MFLRVISYSKILGMLGYGNFIFACKFLEELLRKVTNIFLSKSLYDYYQIYKLVINFILIMSFLQ